MNKKRKKNFIKAILKRYRRFQEKAKRIYLFLTGKAIFVKLNSLSIEDDSIVTQLLHDMKPPVFIFGPPRSGSTYLVHAMNTHENIYITNELRALSFINDLFRQFFSSKRMEWSLHPDFRQHLRQEMAGVVRKFYLPRMPNSDAVWGDKHPHYSDPAMDPGALDTILDLFPEARFIHIYRNPREQIHSVVKKGWKDFKYSVRAYRRIVTTGQGLGRKVGSDRYLEIKYEDLTHDGENVANQICNFLGIPPSVNWQNFMRAQARERTPYSAPVTNVNDIGRPKIISFSPEEEIYFEKILGDLIKKLDY